MRRLIAAGVLLTFIVVCCVVGQLTVGGCGRDMTGLLVEARKAAQNRDFTAAEAAAKKAEQEYANHEWRLSFFIHHSLVEELGEQLAALPALANSEAVEEFLSQLDSAKIKILHIMRDNRLSLHNLF